MFLFILEKNSYQKVVETFTKDWKDTQQELLKTMKEQDEKLIDIQTKKQEEILEKNLKAMEKILEKDREETAKLMQGFLNAMQPVHPAYMFQTSSFPSSSNAAFVPVPKLSPQDNASTTP